MATHGSRSLPPPPTPTHSPCHPTRKSFFFNRLRQVSCIVLLAAGSSFRGVEAGDRPVPAPMLPPPSLGAPRPLTTWTVPGRPAEPSTLPVQPSALPVRPPEPAPAIRLVQVGVNQPPPPPEPGNVSAPPAGLPEPLDPAPTGDGAPWLEFVGEPSQEIEVVVNRSRLFQARRPVSRLLVANPTVADVQLVDRDQPNANLFNLFGQSFGTTTLTIWDDRQRSESFLVRVTIDTGDLQERIAEVFPGAQVTIRQVGSQVILEGQVPSSKVMNDVLQLVASELRLNAPNATVSTTSPTAPAGGHLMSAGATESVVVPGVGAGRIINRVRVPGPHQVLLRVKIAELNRSALRQLGINWLDTRNNAVLGSTIGGVGGIGATGNAAQNSAFSPLSLLPLTVGTPLGNRLQAPGFSPVASAFNAAASASNTGASQLFGIFDAGEFNLFINALRTNSLAKILAEPNLVTLDGQPARFQAGGQFPYPVPQAGAGGVGSVITIDYAQYGAILSFIPHILDDEVIRLDVEPNFSELNFAQSFAIPGTGASVPGINSRNARTVVELREGQTLAIAGLLSTRTTAATTRIPGLGDLPIVGPWFSRNTIETVETELVVLVTPELVEPIEACEVPPSPGELVQEPNDWEFYFLGRIEGKTGLGHRATVHYQDPLNVMKHVKSEARWVIGPHGHAD